MAWKWDGGVMCFSPTMEEFRDFSKFIVYMEEQGAHKCGVAKVLLQLLYSIILVLVTTR